MSVRVKLYDKDVNEEEVEQNQNQKQDQSTSTNKDQNSDVDQLKQQYAEVQGKIAFLDKDYNAKKQPLLTQLAAIKNTAAKMGIILAESTVTKFDFSTKLYESVVNTGKTDELSSAVKETFDNLPNISYYMDDKGCLTLAKRFLAFLNEQSWNDGENHWNEASDFLTNTLSKANISLSSREMSEFINTFQNVLKNRTMFSWIFGRQVPEAVEPAQDDVPVEDELPEQAVYQTGETEDQFDTRYFGDLGVDDLPGDDETYDGINADEPFFGEPADDVELYEELLSKYYGRLNK